MSQAEIPTSLLADVATGLWRLRRRLHEAAPGEAAELVRRLTRDAEAVLDSLKEAQVEIQDHASAPYEASQSLRVAAFQPTAGLESDRIVETLKPTVYYRAERIQVGEVVVGIPDRG